MHKMTHATFSDFASSKRVTQLNGIFAVLAFAGMRVSELRNLLVQDIDFQNNWIYILSRDGFENKTGQDWKVPIHPLLLEMLTEYKVRSQGGWFFFLSPLPIRI